MNKNLNSSFVDESGDPVHYNRHGQLIVGNSGCSPIFILGFIETQNPKALRKHVRLFQEHAKSNHNWQDIPSLKKTLVAPHAKDDHPLIRDAFFNHIANCDFSAQFVVARKQEMIFLNDFGGKPKRFYDYLVSCLFEQTLHRYPNNHIYIAQRGSKPRLQPLRQAIETGVKRFESKTNKSVKTNISVNIQTPSGELCLSVIDYMNWALYRAYTQRDMTYFDIVRDRVSYIVDIYDDDKRPRNRYNRRNPFHINKTTPL